MFKAPITWRFRRPEYAEVREFILRKMPAGSCAEIGVANGDFSAKILEINQPRLLYLIDPWFDKSDLMPRRNIPSQQRFENVQRRFATEIADHRVALIRETSESAAAKIADASLDWVYIDGDHRYEVVKRDLECYFPKVKAGGYIVCDDYHYRGAWNDGVTRAVDEFMTSGACRKILERRSQFVMRKPV